MKQTTGGNFMKQSRYLTGTVTDEALRTLALKVENTASELEALASTLRSACDNRLFHVQQSTGPISEVFEQSKYWGEMRGVAAQTERNANAIYNSFRNH